MYLLHLPNSLTADIVTQYLDMQSIGKLDSAVCCSAARRQYLQIYAEKNFVLGFKEHGHVTGAESLIRWLTHHQVVLEGLRLPVVGIAVHMNTLTLYLRSHGDHVKHLDLNAERQVMMNIANIKTVIRHSPKLFSISNMSLASMTKAVAKLLNSMEDLQSLTTVNTDDSMGAAGVLDYLGGGAQNLRRITVPMVYVATQVAIAVAEHCPLIEDVSLEAAEADDQLIENFARCPHLKFLRIHMPVHHQPYFGAHALQQVAKGCPRLEVLCIPGGAFIHSATLEALALHCPLLTELRLKFASRPAEQQAPQAWTAVFPRLRRLDLQSSEGLSDDDIVGIGRGCPELEYLSLHQCMGPTEVGIAELAAGCPNLCELELPVVDARVVDSVLQATTYVVEAVARHCQKLRVLRFSRNTMLSTVRCFAALASGCPVLHTIDARDTVGSLTAEAAVPFAASLLSVKVLFMSQVTPEAWAILQSEACGFVYCGNDEYRR